MEELTLDSLRTININDLAFNKDKLGPLVFENAAPLLEKLQKLSNEFDELDYNSNLSTHEINEINNFKNRLLESLKKLQQFDISQPNPKEIHDQFESEITNWYNDVTRQLRPSLVYLRQEIGSEKADIKKQQKEAIKAKKEFEELKKQYSEQTQVLNKQIEKLNREQEKVEKGHGQLATKILAKYFESEALDNKEDAKIWGIWRWRFFIALAIAISLNVVAYFLIFTFGNKLHIWQLQTQEFFTIEYLIAKAALLILLSYGVVFSSRQFSINSNLAATNRHRRNVASTIEDYLGTNPDEGIKSQIIKQGAEAMFKQFPTGYIGKSEPRDSAPIHEVFTAFANNRG